MFVRLSCSYKSTRMKRSILFLLVLLTGLVTNHTYATHLMGSEISYVSTGNRTYDVYIKVYRDCNGIQISQSNLIARAGIHTLTFSNQTKLSVRDVTGTQNCANGSKCSGGSYPYGVEEHTWKVSIDLSAHSDCDWILSWEQSARNSNITTGSANQNYYVEAQLNACITNSSPVFSVLPIRILCQNSEVIYNMGLEDTVDQGDSFSFALVSALQAANTSVTYSGNFTPTAPLTFYGFPNASLAYPAGFHLNPVTGDLYFRPVTVNQVAVIVIEVREWRTIGGVKTLIGKTRRDMQVIVINCALQNNTPSIQAPLSYEVCSGDSISLPFPTYDADSSDSTRIYYHGSVPGMTFTHNNGAVKNATGYIHWKTTANDVAINPYIVTFNVKDDACPLNAEISRSVVIFVRDSNSRSRYSAGPDIPLPFGMDTVPAIGIDSFSTGQLAAWRTTGDGYFMDSLEAITTYVLGANDKLSCSFEFIRVPLTSFSCGITEPDTSRIYRTPGLFEADILSQNTDSVELTATSDSFPGHLAWWTTLGDGVFTDSLDPNTTYFPGPQDSANCGTTLIWNRNLNGNCGPQTDPVPLLINYEQISLTIQLDSFQTDSVFLSISNPVSGPANWFSSGSGTWVVDSVNYSAIYYPSQGDRDSGYVLLSVEQQGRCAPLSDEELLNLTPLSFEKVLLENMLKVYPNPTQDQLTIEIDNDWRPSEIKVYDMMGRLLINEPWKGDLVQRVQLGGLATGIYILEVSDLQGNSSVHKVSKY